MIMKLLAVILMINIFFAVVVSSQFNLHPEEETAKASVSKKNGEGNGEPVRRILQQV